MKIAIYGRRTIDNTSDFIVDLFEHFERYPKIEVIIHETFYKFLKKNASLPGTYQTFSEKVPLPKNIHCILSLGGDGTFLDTVVYIKHSGIPILGINTGRLGFLANVAKAEIKAALDSVIHKKYTIDKRTLLTLQTKNKLFGNFNYAINELTLMKKDTSAMITIKAYINGEFLNTYFADGLIVATPTGSTAYSLSCGGPLVTPSSQTFIITPIAPHNLNVRPLVISDNSTVELEVEGRSNSFLVSLDSRSENIDSSYKLTITKADFCINMIKLENQNFFNTIRNKLLWGLDIRH